MTEDYNKAKFDKGKLRHDLILPEYEDALADVLTFGAEKYSAHSWKTVPDKELRYYAAMRRHLNAWRQGEKIDGESGLPHLAHAATNLYFLLQWELELDKMMANAPTVAQVAPPSSLGGVQFTGVGGKC